MVIRLYTRLDDAIGDGGVANLIEDEFDISRAGLAYALDMRDYEHIDNVGSYGSLGAGWSWVEVEADDITYIVGDDVEDYAPILDIVYDGDESYATINEDDAMRLMPEDGETTRDQINEIVGKIWDGNNWTGYQPSRSENFCHEPDIETYPWGTAEYEIVDDGDGNAFCSLTALNVATNWICLAEWSNRGFESSESRLTEDEADRLREMIDYDEDTPGIPEVETFEDQNCDAYAIFCRVDDLPSLRLELIMDLNPDDNEILMSSRLLDADEAFDWVHARKNETALAYRGIVAASLGI